MKARRAIVALSVASAAVAETVGAVSLTRIARVHLGFPPGLAWTLTASVAVGAVAGAIMWSAWGHGSQQRRTGVRLNVSCSTLCAGGVGLDHAVNATEHLAWQAIAFLVGAFLPLLSTWLVHALAKVGATGIPAKTEPPTKIATAVADEPEFIEPAPIARRVAQRGLEAIPNAPAVEVDAETVREIDEIEIHRVMRDTKPRVNREVAEIMVRDGVSRATAYRRAKGGGRDAAALA